jgi:hypothetical protein
MHLERAVHLFYESGARWRAVVVGQSGFDIARKCDASRGRSVCNKGPQLLDDGGERLLRDCERRSGRGYARLMALGRRGEVKGLAAACTLPEQL